MNFLIFPYFRKTLLDQCLWIFIEWSDDVIPSQFITHIIHENVKNVTFWQMQVKVCPCIKICGSRNNFSFIFSKYKDGFTFAYLKMRFLPFSVYEMCRKLWGCDIITSPYLIFMRTVQEMFSENKGNFKMS